MEKADESGIAKVGWYARLGSNQRLSAPEADALSTELRARKGSYSQLGRLVKFENRLKPLLFAEKGESPVFRDRLWLRPPHTESQAMQIGFIIRGIFHGMPDSVGNVRNHRNVRRQCPGRIRRGFPREGPVDFWVMSGSDFPADRQQCVSRISR